MIIRPINTFEDFEQYFRNRNRNEFTTYFDKNVAKDDSHEMDVYDFDSFHVGAFEENVMLASCRVMNGVVNSFSPNKEVSKIITQLSTSRGPRKKLQLLEFVKEDERTIINDFFHKLEKSNKEFSEISRLQKIEEHRDKLLMNYIICYAWAFGRFFNIDYCFFNASIEHCMYYERYFNCKIVFPEIEFYPVEGAKPCYMMQAVLEDLTPRMNLVVNRMVEKFKEAGEPCAVNLNEIK